MKQATLIDGVRVKPITWNFDERGRLVEILRADDEIFKQFGQTYCTTAKPGIVKGWHHHKLQDDNFSCVHGAIRLALYDARPDSTTFGQINEFILSVDHPILVQIPPEVYHGFKCISQEEAIVINVPTLPYNHASPDESRIDPYENDIPYDWRK